MLFTTPEADELENQVIDAIDETRERLRYMLSEPRRWVGQLRRTSFARNIQASNSIEGFNVSLDDAVAAVDGDIEPIEAGREDWLAVSSYREAMTYVMQLAEDPYFAHSEALLRSLHYMMMQQDFQAKPGLYRPGTVYVVSGATGDVVYEGPEPEIVPLLVQELVDGLNNDESKCHPMVKAGMAHLNLVMIHPFKDGNGRMARALQTLVLARDQILAPELSSIEEYLGRNTPAYYDVLGQTGAGSWNPERDARPWMRFVLLAHYRQALTLIRRVKEADKLWEGLDLERQKYGLNERVMGSLYNAAYGYKVRRSDHIAYAEVAEAAATRDLKKLVTSGLLVPVGERRGRFYIAGDDLKRIREQSLEPRQPIPDPFGGGR